MAQLGRALGSGPRGRRFKSCFSGCFVWLKFNFIRIGVRVRMLIFFMCMNKNFIFIILEHIRARYVRNL